MNKRYLHDSQAAASTEDYDKLHTDSDVQQKMTSGYGITLSDRTSSCPSADCTDLPYQVYPFAKRGGGGSGGDGASSEGDSSSSASALSSRSGGKTGAAIGAASAANSRHHGKNAATGRKVPMGRSIALVALWFVRGVSRL